MVSITMYIDCLVVWHMVFMIFHTLGKIIPTDELLFLRGVGQPPTRYYLEIIWKLNHILVLNYIPIGCPIICKHHMNHLDLFCHVPRMPSRPGFAVGPRSAKMEDAFAARLVGLAVSMTHHGENKNPDENTI